MFREWAGAFIKMLNLNKIQKMNTLILTPPFNKRQEF